MPPLDVPTKPVSHPHPIGYLLILAFFVVIAMSTGEADQGSGTFSQIAASDASASPAPSVSISSIDASVPQSQDTPVTQPVAAHMPTPNPVRAAYLTAWSAGNTKTVQRIEDLEGSTELNAVVIDIKDATGKLSYKSDDPALAAVGSGTNRIPDLSALTADLHTHGIYVIGRVQVFEDPFYSTVHPEDAFVDTRTNTPWQDYKGIRWLKPNSEDVWNYIASIAENAYAHGVDEINVDYVRFPSDGPLQFLDKSDQTQSREDTLALFFTYLDERLRPQGIILSADLFGLTTSATDDLGIGQKLELVAPHVDYVSPMVYPSHFAAGSYGIALPAEHPYEIIHTSLTDAEKKLAAIGIGPEKLRPWLQDFNLGAVYTSDMVRAQITASEELGVNSWMLWNASNVYTVSALDPDPYADTQPQAQTLQ